jgi:hypothetical protein
VGLLGTKQPLNLEREEKKKKRRRRRRRHLIKCIVLAKCVNGCVREELTERKGLMFLFFYKKMLNDYEITDRQIGGKRKQPKQNTQNQTEEL